MTAGNVKRLTLSTEFATLPLVTVPQLDSLERQGERLFSRTRTPANAQLILVLLQLLSESVLFIDCVASTTIATLNGPANAPLMAAVAVDVSVTELLPNSRAKISGNVICWLTTMAFELEGP